MNPLLSSLSLRRCLLSLASITSLACVIAPAVHAQSLVGSRRTNDISTFVATSAATPDYFPGHAMGITAGADWTTHYTHFATSFEARANRTSAPLVIERSVSFGPRVQTLIGRRYHPYADFLIGGGTIVFLQNSTGYHEDRSMVRSFGGGADIDVTQNFAARIDFQNQGWNLGKTTSNSDVTFSPNILSIGVQYHIPFRPHPTRNY